VDPVVAGDELECQLVALRPALAVDPEAGSICHRRAPPELEVRGAKRFKQGEQRRRVFVVAMERIDPCVLVVAGEWRPVLGEDPAVTAGRDELAVGDVGDALEDAPFAARRSRAQVRARLGDEALKGRWRRGLRDGRVVATEGGKERLLVGRGLGDRIG
jgi:hypothetical protein